jgi:hypothetical protein
MSKPHLTILFFIVLLLSPTPLFPAEPALLQGPDIEVNQELRQKAFMHLGIGLGALVLSSVLTYNSIRWAADRDPDNHAVGMVGLGISVPIGLSGIVLLFSSSSLFSSSKTVAEVKAP